MSETTAGPGLTIFPRHFQMGWIRLMVEYTIPQAIKNKIAHTRKSICLLNSAVACFIT
jgi:hypothetical protein